MKYYEMNAPFLDDSALVTRNVPEFVSEWLGKFIAPSQFSDGWWMTLWPGWQCWRCRFKLDGRVLDLRRSSRPEGAMPYKMVKYPGRAASADEVEAVTETVSLLTSPYLDRVFNEVYDASIHCVDGERVPTSHPWYEFVSYFCEDPDMLNKDAYSYTGGTPKGGEPSTTKVRVKITVPIFRPNLVGSGDPNAAQSGKDPITGYKFDLGEVSKVELAAAALGATQIVKAVSGSSGSTGIAAGAAKASGGGSGTSPDITPEGEQHEDR